MGTLNGVMEENPMISPDALPVEKADALSSREMPHMMMALGIEPALLRADHPALYASMESVCSGCGSRQTCRNDLQAHTAAATFTDYCANASTLSLLRERPEFSRD